MSLKSKMKFLFTAYCIVFLSVLLYSNTKTTNLTAIIGAMPEETALIKKNINNKKIQEHLGVKFTFGVLKGRDVVVVTGGVGKVNAAMVTTLLIDHFHPSEIIFTGIAGGIRPDLNPGDIIIGTKTMQYDLGELSNNNFKSFAVKNPANQKRNPIFIMSDASIIKHANKAAKNIKLESLIIDSKQYTPIISEGIIATGDKFIASKNAANKIRKQCGADAVEMEGAAVAQICYQTKTPFILLRSISDNANNHAQVTYNTFIKIASKNSANLTMALIEELYQKRFNFRNLS